MGEDMSHVARCVMKVCCTTNHQFVDRIGGGLELVICGSLTSSCRAVESGSRVVESLAGPCAGSPDGTLMSFVGESFVACHLARLEMSFVELVDLARPFKLPRFAKRPLTCSPLLYCTFAPAPAPTAAAPV